MLTFPASHLKKVLQLQLQQCSCSSSTFINQSKMSNYLYIPGFVIINGFISTIIQFAAAAAAAIMRLQGCSCSSNIFLKRFRMSNNPYVRNLVIMNKLFPKLFNLLLIPASYLKKCCSCSSSSSIDKFFDTMILILILNEEKSMSFRKKF